MIFIEYSIESRISTILAMVSVTFALIAMIDVFRKAIKSKERILFLFCMIIFFLFSIWYVPSIAYLYWLITKNPIDYEWFILGYNAFYPFFVFSWLYIYTSVIFVEKKKIILGVYMFFIILLEIYLFYFLFFAPKAPIQELLGKVEELKTSNTSGLLLFGMFSTSVCCITSIHYTIYLIKNANTKEKLSRGRLLLAGFILLNISMVLEALIPPSYIIIIIVARIVLMISTFLLIMGFSPPKWFKNLIMSGDEEKKYLENVISIFKRPEKITVEEVTYYREQRQCLVCKGKVGTTKFLCNCGALYCTKCTFALIEIENICWACENALDKTKPVKIPEWIEDNVAHGQSEEDKCKYEKKRRI